MRVKAGYNPNSSSIGSIVFAVPSMLLISSVIFGSAMSIIFAKFIKKTDGADSSSVEEDSKESFE